MAAFLAGFFIVGDIEDFDRREDFSVDVYCRAFLAVCFTFCYYGFIAANFSAENEFPALFSCAETLVKQNILNASRCQIFPLCVGCCCFCRDGYLFLPNFFFFSLSAKPGKICAAALTGQSSRFSLTFVETKIRIMVTVLRP